MEQETHNILSIYHERIRNFCAEENWKEANQLADTSISRARQSYDIDPVGLEELALSLEIKGDILRQTGELEASKEFYEEALELFENKARFTEALARISASVAVVHDSLEDSLEAARYYQRSIDLFNRLDPPAVLDIADLSNNLAFIFRDNGDTDQAETLFLQALEICHKEFGIEHEETALLCNNLGALYSNSNHHQQAREMQRMALEGRLASLGEDHIDTAQTHANLAVAEANIDNIDEAKNHFELAIHTLEKHLTEAPSDYATVTANYAQFLHSINEEKAASIIEKKAAKHIKHLH